MRSEGGKREEETEHISGVEEGSCGRIFGGLFRVGLEIFLGGERREREEREG